MENNAHQAPSARVSPPRRRRWLWLAIVVLVVGAGLVWAGVARGWFGGKSSDNQVILVPVKKGHLTIDVSVAGSIRNRDQVIIKSEVEGRSTILQLVDEGTRVKKGDLLIELDSSNLVDQQVAQQILVMNADAANEKAKQTLDVTRLQSKSDKATAKVNYELAQLDLKKYEEGDFPQLDLDAKSKIKIAEETLKRAQDALTWSQILFDKKYLSKNDLSADELAAEKAQLDLDSAKEQLAVLVGYTKARQMSQYSSAVASTQVALECAIRKAEGDIAQAVADAGAKQAEYDRQKQKLDKLDRQIVKCKIYAPIDAMVVYATTGQMNWARGGGSADPLAEGQDVRERQELIYLPTAASMLAAVRIHESVLDKVKVGMPVSVIIDAVPGHAFAGTVSKIALLPDAQAVWQNPDLKEYSTQVAIDDDSGLLRAGMSCKCRIIIDEYDDALYIPVQAVVRVKKQATVYQPGPQGPKPVPVEIGLDNNKIVRIVSGLNEGEQIILNPPMQAGAVSELGTHATAGPAVPTAAHKPHDDAATMPATQPLASGDPADPAAATQPATKLLDFRKMTPDERRKYLDGLTPEQREEARRRFPRRPAGDGPPA